MFLTLFWSMSRSVCTDTVLGTSSSFCSVRVAVTVTVSNCVGVFSALSAAKASDGESNSKTSQGLWAKGGRKDMDLLLDPERQVTAMATGLISGRNVSGLDMQMQTIIKCL